MYIPTTNKNKNIPILQYITTIYEFRMSVMCVDDHMQQFLQIMADESIDSIVIYWLNDKRTAGSYTLSLFLPFCFYDSYWD